MVIGVTYRFSSEVSKYLDLDEMDQVRKNIASQIDDQVLTPVQGQVRSQVLRRVCSRMSAVTRQVSPGSIVNLSDRFAR